MRCVIAKISYLGSYLAIMIFYLLVVATILKSGPSGKLESWVSHLCVLYHHSSFLLDRLSEDSAEHVG